jgi:hypothetical protein
MSSKTIILFEMTFLFLGSLAIAKENRPHDRLADVLVDVAPRRAIASALVLALLLLMADLGAGEAAAWFGLLIIASALLAYGGRFALGLEQIIERI